MARLKILANGMEVKNLTLEESQEYFAGRDEGLDIPLQDESVSRRHFKIYFDGAQWKVEKLSKFGKLIYQEAATQGFTLRDSDTFFVPPFTLLFERQEMPSVVPNVPTPPQNLEFAPLDTGDKTLSRTQAASQQYSEATERFGAPPGTQTSSIEPSNISSPTEIISGSPDGTVTNATEVGPAAFGVPYLTVSAPGRAPELLRLEGEAWKVGRGSQCEVRIDDEKASRYHFELKKLSDGYYIFDLGSSNGTSMNGHALESKQTVPLSSGDQITVGSTTMLFEIRDPNFEHALREIPAEMMAVPQPPAPLPVFDGGGFGPPGGNYFPPERLNRPPARSSGSFPIRYFLMGLAVVLLWAVLSQKPNQQVTQPDYNRDDSKQMASNDPKAIFDRLTKEQQQFIVSTYQLGTSLFMRGKYESALREFEKIHELVPSYEKSRSLTGLSQEAIQTKVDRERIEQDQQKEQQLKRQIANTIQKCEALSRSPNATVESMRACLAPALELDPDNSTAVAIVARVQAREDAAERSAVAAKGYQARVKAGEEIFNKAKKLEERGAYMDAIEVFESHMKSQYPDPQNLKDRSKRSIASIKSNINSKVASLLADADAKAKAAQSREAVAVLNKALTIDPDNQQAEDLKEKIIGDLYKQMKILYSDSVLEENLGNIDSAKKKWQEILEKDIPNGEYFNKAKVKLSKYGGV